MFKFKPGRLCGKTSCVVPEPEAKVKRDTLSTVIWITWEKMCVWDRAGARERHELTQSGKKVWEKGQKSDPCSVNHAGNVVKTSLGLHVSQSLGGWVSTVGGRSVLVGQCVGGQNSQATSFFVFFLSSLSQWSVPFCRCFRNCSGFWLWLAAESGLNRATVCLCIEPPLPFYTVITEDINHDI